MLGREDDGVYPATRKRMKFDIRRWETAGETRNADSSGENRSTYGDGESVGQVSLSMHENGASGRLRRSNVDQGCRRGAGDANDAVLRKAFVCRARAYVTCSRAAEFARRDIRSVFFAFLTSAACGNYSLRDSPWNDIAVKRIDPHAFFPRTCYYVFVSFD